MSKHIKSENVKFKVSHVAYALIAAVAASATLTAHAATRNWIHGEEGVANTPESPYTIQDLANWSGSGDTRNDGLYLSVTERTYIQSTNDTVRLGNSFCPNSGEFVFTGSMLNFQLKAGYVADSTVSILKKSGDWTFSLTSGGSSQIGAAANTTVVFTNESGNVNVTASAGSFHKIGAGDSSYAKVVNLSGNWTVANSNNLMLADGAGSTGIVENVSGNWSVSNQLRVAETGYGEFTQYGGSLTVGGDLYICYSSSGRGVLTIKGGTVTVPPDKSVQLRNGTGTNAINLDGGTLVTPTISRGGGDLVINFNGGTLKANASTNLLADANSTRMAVHVNAGGGVIDCGGYAVTLKPGIGCSGDTGSLTFTGGNIITIDNDINYGGVTYIASNTTVKATNARISTLLSHGVELVGALELNTPYTILASTAESDDWSSLDRSKVTCPAASAFSVDLGADNKSITVTVTALKTGYWTGAAGDNNLSTEGNWSGNTVPTSGNATFECIAPATLTKGESFAATSITFAEGCSPVTIDGDFTTLTSVTNNSPVNQTFAGFVDFGAGDIDVTQTGTYSDNTGPTPGVVSGGCVVFAGGVKGNDIVDHKVLTGNYELTKASDFIATTVGDARIVINENSSLSVKNAGDTKELYICEGATFNVADFSNVDNRLCNWNKGTLIVTNFTYTITGYFCLGGYTQNSSGSDANANAVLKAGTLTINSSGTLGLSGTGNSTGATLKMYIGEGGLNIASGKAGYYRVLTSAHRTTMYPWNSDFTFGRGSSKEYDFLLGDDKGNGIVNFTLNTDDEAGVPRTITMDARICTATNTWTIAVAGHGTNVVTSASPLMTGTYAVTDAATVKFDGTKKFNNEAAGFANGTIALDDGTTLEYTNSGSTLALPCKTLVLPETGKATLRINGERLRSGDHILVEGVSAGAESLLNVELAETVKDGRRYDVAVKDGNLVLHVIPSSGVMLIVF